jgi:3-phenylpropionate/trans-cinnamate dioxygenase ferredoxin reductase component
MSSQQLSDLQQTAIVVGASHAGSQLAIHLRKSGWLGRIVLIGDEAHLPYHRPPLSKAVMSGSKNADDIQLRPSALYQNNQIELKLGSHVEAILRDDQRVLLSTGETLHYDRLALCTGASPVRLPLGDGLDGVFYLRSLDDVLAIRNKLPQVKQAVIVGAGYIGLEAAAVLRSLGVGVTVLERADRVLKRVTGEQVSEYFSSLHQLHGVNIHCNAEVTAINGQDSVESVSCADGSQFEAQLVIIGVGVVPEIRLAQEAGLRIENGICVDEYARTSDEKIFAAGDCASHPSFLYQRRLRLESVQNANDQSRVAAVNMIQLQEKYSAAPWFWSDQYDIKLQSAGLWQGFDALELEGSLDAANKDGFVLKYFSQGHLIAADCANRPKDFMAIKTALAQRT